MTENALPQQKSLRDPLPAEIYIVEVLVLQSVVVVGISSTCPVSVAVSVTLAQANVPVAVTVVGCVTHLYPVFSVADLDKEYEVPLVPVADVVPQRVYPAAGPVMLFVTLYVAVYVSSTTDPFTVL